jgi:plasmid stabilization system protein ParE
MNGQVYWSPDAKSDYKRILNYLNENWSPGEILKFAGKVEHDILNLVLHPKMGIVSKKKSIRRIVISKQTSHYYKNIRADIYIIALFDNRQNPKKLNF